MTNQIKHFLYLAVIICTLLYLTPIITHASTRLRMEGPTQTIPLNTKAPLRIRVMSDESEQAGPQEREKVTVKIKQGAELNPQCAMMSDISDSDGFVTAYCASSHRGTLIVYAQSVDKSDISNEVELRFDDITPNQSADQSNQTSEGGQANPKQDTITQNNSNTQTAFASGLEDTTTTDLQTKNSGGMVLGQATSQSDDLSLITSLIFFAAGIVLLITASYTLILLTKKKKAPILSSKHEDP